MPLGSISTQPHFHLSHPPPYSLSRSLFGGEGEGTEREGSDGQSSPGPPAENMIMS